MWTDGKPTGERPGRALRALKGGAVMAEAIVKDRRHVLPCSCWLQGEFGLNDVFCGVPATSVFVRPFTSNDTSLAVTVVAASGFGMTTAIGDGVAEVEARRVAPL